MAKVTAVCLSTTLQRVATFERFDLEKVNRAKKYSMYSSGKAVNVCRVLNQLEENFSEVICPIGESDSKRFLEMAEKEKISVKGVLVPGFVRECITLLDRNLGTTTEMVIDEPVLECDFSSYEKKLVEQITSSVEKTDSLILAGSRPKIWSENLCTTILKIAYDKGKIVMADFRGEDLINALKVCTPQIIKINEDEFFETFGEDKNNDAEKLKDLICFHSKRLDNIIVVTRGKLETYAAEKGTLFIEPTEKIKPLNTIGCGDSFSAGFLYEFLRSRKTSDALKKGTWCAARNAEREAPGDIL